MQQLSGHFATLASATGIAPDALLAGAEKIRAAARVGTSVEAILEQQSNDAAVVAAGKLAIVHYALQAEGQSPLAREPRGEGELPLRGTENWLFHLGRLVTSGVPRERCEQAFDNLAIISFNYDRSIEQYLPFVVMLAFGMPLDEARELVATRLNITHPFGNAGRLPWEGGDAQAVEWGQEQPSDPKQAIAEIQLPSERASVGNYVAGLQGALAGSERIVFLGFDFDPQAMALLIDRPLGQSPEILAAVQGMNAPTMAGVRRMLARRTGVSDADALQVLDTRCFHLLRDYALLLES